MGDHARPRASAEPLMQKVIATGEPLVGIELTGETPAQPGYAATGSECSIP